jgi:hypothetical protein
VDLPPGTGHEEAAHQCLGMGGRQRWMDGGPRTVRGGGHCSGKKGEGLHEVTGGRRRWEMRDSVSRVATVGAKPAAAGSGGEGKGLAGHELGRRWGCRRSRPASGPLASLGRAVAAVASTRLPTHERG